MADYILSCCSTADLTPEQLESDAIKNYCVKKDEPKADAEAEAPASTAETSAD